MAKATRFIEGIPVYEAFMNPSQDNFPAYKMDPEFITIHETENHDEGADARMHSEYLLNGAGGRKASWHYTVDEHCIYQHAKHNQSVYAAGDGNGDGNRKSINIELCEDEGSDFQKTVKNAQALVRSLMAEEKIPLKDVTNHNHWSGKNCPNNILKYWDNFIDGIESKEIEPVKIKPVPPKNNVNNSIVDYLISVGKDHDLASRKRYAKEYGFKEYEGTALQNLELLRKMQQGGPSREIEPTPVNKPSSYKGDSVVEYLNSIDVDSSFASRTRLATRYGIANYKGTASQNLALLDKLKTVPVKKVEHAKPEGDQNTTSIVDYLRSVKVTPSFINRKALAARYGIKGYTGTADQNTLLLNKLRNK